MVSGSQSLRLWSLCVSHFRCLLSTSHRNCICVDSVAGIGCSVGESLPFGLQFSCLRNRLDSAFCMETYVFGHEFVGNFVKVAVCCG
jgi:hypothetical protein